MQDGGAAVVTAQHPHEPRGQPRRCVRGQIVTASSERLLEGTTAFTGTAVMRRSPSRSCSLPSVGVSEVGADKRDSSLVLHHLLLLRLWEPRRPHGLQEARLLRRLAALAPGLVPLRSLGDVRRDVDFPAGLDRLLNGGFQFIGLFIMQ